MRQKRLAALLLLQFLVCPGGRSTGAAGDQAPIRRVGEEELPAGFFYSTDKVCNGDRVKTGYGCVSGELSDYGIDTSIYYQGGRDSQVLLTADSAARAYIYLYKSSAAEIYDRVTVSTSTVTADGVEYAEDWSDYDIQNVSYSANGALYKYEIVGLAPSTRYAVAKLYNSATKDDINTILTVSYEYLTAVDPDDPTKKITTINQLESIKVLDTYNAYQLMRRSSTDDWNQMHYAVFNLDQELDKIQKVELQYYKRPYICDTTIKDTVADAKEDRFTYGFSREKCKTVNWLHGAEHQNITVTPESKEVWTNGFGWARTRYTWTTLGDTASYSDKIMSPELKQRYKWFVNFDNNTIHAPRKQHGMTGYYDLTDPERPAIDISQLNFLQFWYTKNGETRTAIAVDRYTDSSGNVPIIKGDDTSALASFFAKIGHFFSLYGPFMLLAVGVIAGVWVLSKLRYVFFGGKGV